MSPERVPQPSAPGEPLRGADQARSSEGRALPGSTPLERLDALPGGAVPSETTALSLVHAAAATPAALQAVWRALDARIVAGAHAAWGHRVGAALLAEGGPLASPSCPAGTWGAFVTTCAECLLRDPGATPAADLWQRAWDALQALEPAEERAALLVRAASGGLIQATYGPDRAMTFDGWVARLYALIAERQVAVTSPSQVAPVIAAVLACAEALDRDADPFVPAHPLVERLATAASEVRRGPERALALAVCGRLARRRQDPELARGRCLEALHVAGTCAERDFVPNLLWPAGLDGLDRVRLDAAVALTGLEPVSRTRERLGRIPRATATISCNRLDALEQRLALADRAARQTSRPPGAGRVTDDDLAWPTAAAHHALPPRAAMQAMGALEAGQPARALAWLDDLGDSLARYGNRAVERVVRQVQTGAVRRLHAWPPDAHGLTPDEGRRVAVDGESRHRAWQARTAFDDTARAALATWGVRFLTLAPSPHDDEWVRASIALDLVECGDLGADVPVTTSAVGSSPEDWALRHPAHPERAFRLWARGEALGVTRTAPPEALVDHVGVREAARIAAEEGELLMRRLPGQSLRLLAAARTWFEDADDPLGTWQTTVQLTLAHVRTGASRTQLDLEPLRLAHDAAVAALRQRSDAEPLLTWSDIDETTGQALAPRAGEWAPWLLRVLALRRWVEAGVPPAISFGNLPVPPSLRSWPAQDGA